MNKKIKIFKKACLAFTLSLCVLLLIGCIDAMDKQTFKPATGMGYLTLSLGETGRTILPARLYVDDFSKYDLIFTAGSDAPLTFERDNETLKDDPIELPANTYSLKVIAYIDVEGVDVPVAEYNNSNVEIIEGEVTSLIIRLRAIINEAGAKGAFEWNISFDSAIVDDITNVQMAINKITNVTNIDDLFATVTNWETLSKTDNKITGLEEDLDVGYYNVVLKISKKVEIDPNIIETKTIYEILHVYKNLTSVYNFTVTAALFDNSHYTVTFKNHDGNDTQIKNTVEHGETTVAPAIIPKTGFVFEGDVLDVTGWYDESGDEFDFDTPLIDDITLTAKWLRDLSSAVIVVPDQFYDNGNPVTPDTLTVTHFGVPLVLDTDFIIGTYGTNINVGTASIEIRAVEGSGNFGSGEGTFQILPQIINNINITVTHPRTADPPVLTATGTGNFTIGAVSWTDVDGEPTVSMFEGNSIYTATVTLTRLNNNFTFTGLTSARINENENTVPTVGPNGATVTLVLTFDATNPALVTSLSIISPPDNLIYTHGNTLDLGGLGVKLYYNDGNETEVSLNQFADFNNITTIPPPNTELDITEHNGFTIEVWHSDDKADNPNDLGLTITVNRINVVSIELPSLFPTTITFGALLSAITLTPTTMIIESNASPVSLTGSFLWRNQSYRPNAGTRGYDLIFIPDDAVIYNFEGVTGWDNGVIRRTSSNITVNARSTIITPRLDQSKTYGDADTVFLYDVSPVLDADGEFTGALGRAPGENAGSYTFIVAGYLSAGSNYSLTLAPGRTFQIMPRPITITPNQGQGHVYSPTTTTLPLTYNYSPSPLIGTDVFTGTLSRANSGVNNAGSYEILRNNLAINDGNSGLNYIITFTTGVNYVITQAPGVQVAAPTQAGSSTPFTIRINPVTASTEQGVSYQIRYANDETSVSVWQSSTTFSNLTPNTEYLVFARADGNINYTQGNESSASLVMKTMEAPAIYIEVEEVESGIRLNVSDTVVISHSATGFPRIRDIILTNAEEFDPGSIRWIFIHPVSGVTTQLGTEATLRLNANNIIYNQVGIKFITLEVKKDGLAHSERFQFEVRN
jgi:hypothetical protein